MSNGPRIVEQWRRAATLVGQVQYLQSEGVRGCESKLTKTEPLQMLLLRFPFGVVASDVECGGVECAMQCGEQFELDMVKRSIRR